MPGKTDPDMRRSGTFDTGCDRTLVYSSGTTKPGDFQSSLFVIRGDRLGACLTIGASPVTIGRSADADFQISSTGVSRWHCQLFRAESSLWVRDLDSTNGTFVNDKPAKEAELLDGDQVRVAQTIFKCVIDSSYEASYHHAMYEGLVRDAMTGLYNRRFAMEMLSKEVARARRDFSHEFSALILDLDHFKRINDRYGHLNGDKVLREVARVLQQRVRDSDTLARIGGEEFLVLLPDTGYQAALAIADDLRIAVQNQCADIVMIEMDARQSVTLSAGVAAWTAQMRMPADLLQVADRQLYQAKAKGRNRVA